MDDEKGEMLGEEEGWKRPRCQADEEQAAPVVTARHIAISWKARLVERCLQVQHPSDWKVYLNAHVLPLLTCSVVCTSLITQALPAGAGPHT